MGLDMNVYGSYYFFGENDAEKAEKVKALFPEIAGADVSMVKAEFMYWRKANAIHRWFVVNVQDGNDDCGDYGLSMDNLRSLREVCEKVLADPDRAPELLPTQEGFFFGGTEYNENYFDDLRDTLNWLNDILLKGELGVLANWYLYYSSSW